MTRTVNKENKMMNWAKKMQTVINLRARAFEHRTKALRYLSADTLQNNAHDRKVRALAAKENALADKLRNQADKLKAS